MTDSPSPSSLLEPGDEVVLRIGRNEMRVRITEDRGALGPNGERIYRVQMLSDEDADPDDFEVPGTALEPVAF